MIDQALPGEGPAGKHQTREAPPNSEDDCNVSSLTTFVRGLHSSQW